MAMRVMTWNVWGRFGADWRARETSIRATLEAYRPDIVGLQETWIADGTSQPERLGGALGLHHAVIEPGNGLLSRWPIVHTEAHPLPHDERGGEPGTILLSTLDHPRGPLHVLVTGTEWKPEYAGDHLAQTRALAALATDVRLDGPLPVLLLGDLNAAAEHPVLAPLVDAMVDTWAAGGGDPRAVTLDGKLPIAPADATEQLGRKIDHVFARPGRPGLSVAVHRVFLAGDRPVEGVYPSDHYAVGADVEP